MYNYSVIIPHRNTPALLERCLTSIPLREDIAVLVIDDHSDTPHAEQVKQLCRKRANVHCTLTDKGLGAGYARNVGLEQMNSKWVLFADADDYFIPDAWDIMDKHLDDQADIIYFHSTCCFSDTGKPGDRHLRLNRMIDDYTIHHDEKTEGRLRYNYHEPVGKMIRMSLIRDNRILFEQTRWANDVHFSTRIGAMARSIATDQATIYCITIASGSLVHQHSLESRRCRYEVILRNNAYLRQIGKAEFQDSLMYSLKWAAKLGGLKAVWSFIRLGRTYEADFTHGAGSWIRNYFTSRNEYKDKQKYIIYQQQG